MERKERIVHSTGDGLVLYSFVGRRRSSSKRSGLTVRLATDGPQKADGANHRPPGASLGWQWR
ncbi:hypothetical protein B0I35DRAFT_440746 [Stachybotrys elegans]|uniref:Uncharacterized protein n=1 Tax=Stachybotrys elegans TaxID=80388 RepID=A0A8K0SMZ1_9HYPO|nr:hypothetical protein B0I35DRAFT_440746 [Stachybotrys elegans]